MKNFDRITEINGGILYAIFKEIVVLKSNFIFYGLFK